VLRKVLAVATVFVLLASLATSLTVSASPVAFDVAVSKRIIASIEGKINGLLSLADEYNIVLNDTLQSFVEEAKSLISEAYSIVNESPREAVMKAFEAAKTFRPVATYILTNIPEEEKAELKKELILRVLEAKEDKLGRLNATVAYLEKIGVSVPEEVYEKISEIQANISALKEIVESGNFTIPYVMRNTGRIDSEIAKLAVMVDRLARHRWEMLMFLDRGIHRFHYALVIAAKGINKTADLISEGEIDEAKNLLEKLVSGLEKLNEYVSRAADLARERGVNETVVETLTDISEALNSTCNDLMGAEKALEENNTAVALSLVSSALDRLVSIAEKHGETFRNIHVGIERAKMFSREIAVRLRRKLAEEAVRKTAQLTMFVKFVDVRLNKLYWQFKNGTVSAEEFKSKLENTKTVLETIKEKLTKLPKQPKMLLTMIDKVLEKINNMLSQV